MTIGLSTHEPTNLHPLYLPTRSHRLREDEGARATCKAKIYFISL